MKRAFHPMSIDKALAQLGMAMCAQVVDGVNAIFELEDGNVMAPRFHRDACALKNIGLCAYVGPVCHGQMG